jgi:hypothetical protein
MNDIATLRNSDIMQEIKELKPPTKRNETRSILVRDIGTDKICCLYVVSNGNRWVLDDQEKHY